MKLHTPGFTEVGGLLILPHGARAEARAKEEEVVAERPCSAIPVGCLQGACGNAWARVCGDLEDLP